MCIEVKYLPVSRCRQCVKMEKDIIDWNEIIKIPVPEPIISQKIYFYVKDKKIMLSEAS